MGMRRNIELTYSNDQKIYLYTHWGAETMEEELKNALERGINRWCDESYLARIIISEFIKDDILSDTGFGIAPYVMEEEYPTIRVDLKNGSVNGIGFNQFIK